MRATRAAVMGAILLVGCGTAGTGESGGPSETPSATVEATLTGAMSLVDAPGGGDLPAGDYYLDLPQYPARVDFTVPEGWWHFWPGSTRETSDANAILVNSEDTAASGS